MKIKSDPRHQNRVKRMKALFSASFHKDQSFPEEIADLAEVLPNIDQQIIAAAPEWPLSQINKIDLAILRLSVHELTTTDTPHKVVIDEAVEIAKEYGSENSAKFINGVLGTIHEKLS